MIKYNLLWFTIRIL